MRIAYDRSFSPYVIPGGVPIGRDVLPDARWFAAMALGQARGFVGEQLIRARERLPGSLRVGRVGREIEALQQRLVPPAPGRVPTEGDAEFAYQRFAGVNPLRIARARDLADIPEKLRLGDELHGRILGGGSGYSQRANRAPTGATGCHELTQRVAHGQIFIVRYDHLRVTSQNDLQEGKFVAPARALFCYAPEMDAPFPVVPLAIECATGRADGETALITPLAEHRWRDAKRLVGVADINDAELCLHLARAHFMTVPFAIALRRNLPPAHPLYLFLMPHLRFDMFVERMAWLQGMGKTSGILVRSLAGRAQWSQDVARSLYYSLSFREQHFERDLVARGLDSHPVDYPYRDDGQLVWDAIKRFTGGYLRSIYPTDRAMTADEALAGFVREASDPQGGNVRGLLAGDRLETVDELIEILTQVIFVAGPLHAIAHFASAAQLQRTDENPAFLSANPLSAFGETDPGPLRAMYQYTRVMATNVRHDRLGDFSRYELGQMPEHRARIAAFQAELQSVERTIEERNARRFAPYIHFLPSRISNGITV